MKEIEKQLRMDAARIAVTAPAAFKERLAKAMVNTRQPRGKVRDQGRWAPAFFAPGLAGRLAAGVAIGLTAALALLAWSNISDEQDDSRLMVASVVPEHSYTGRIEQLNRVMDSRGAPEAELRSELQRLNSDWQRIRTSVRDQIDPKL